MRSFLFRLGIFVLPLFAVLALPMFTFVTAGELSAIDLESVVREQTAGGRVLFGPAYSDCTKRYKWLGIEASDADVLAVGSSRAMEFRRPMFRRSSRFYNAGGTVSRLPHLAEFFRLLPADRTPRLAIVALDHWFFNSRWQPPREAPFEAQTSSCTTVLNVVQRNWRRVYNDYRLGKFTLLGLSKTKSEYETVGLNASASATGARNDGSYFYGAIVRDPERRSTHHDWHFQDTLGRVARGVNRFEWADHADPALLGQVEDAVASARARGIHMIGFLPPFAPRVLDRMQASGRYGYLRELGPALEATFLDAGMTFFDFTDARPLGAADREFIDGFHGSDRVYLRMLNAMAAGDDTLRSAVDPARLRHLLTEDGNPLSITQEWD